MLVISQESPPWIVGKVITGVRVLLAAILVEDPRGAIVNIVVFYNDIGRPIKLYATTVSSFARDAINVVVVNPGGMFSSSSRIPSWLSLVAMYWPLIVQ